MRSRAKVLMAAGGVAALSGGLLLVPGSPAEQPARAAELTPFEGCDELREWFVKQALERVGPYGLGGGSFLAGAEAAVRGGAPAGMAGMAGMDGAAGVDAAAEEARSLPGDAVGPGATGTNVQEEGVDEPDLVKTDGSRVVTVRGDRLQVVDVRGDRPRLLGSVRLGSDSAGELLLVGDRALVLGTTWRAMPLVEPDKATASDAAPGSPDPQTLMSPLIPPGSPTSVLTVVDLSDPDDPKVLRAEEVEGSYLSAREHDGVVRVVLQSTPSLPFHMPSDPRAADSTTAANRDVIRNATLQDWLPERVVRGAGGGVVDTEPLLDCTDVSHPEESAGLGMLTVLTFDLQASRAPLADRTAVAADGDLVYASQDRLYVATTRGGWGWGWPGAEMMATDAVAVGEGGRTVPVPAPEPADTQVHAFDITARDATAYVASGDVDGRLMGRWAMSEHEGLLRLATTREGRRPAANGFATDVAVTVLRERGDRLRVLGSVGGLGKGEEVRAVRWFGEVATVVTFRQTDPLYTVDLSDPDDPRVMGELKVPGYSAYLHPLGDGLLLGVGQDATEEGQTLGVQVSTFDLSDLADPRRVDVLTVRHGWTEVEADSRQFTYLPDHRLAIMPLSGEGGSALWSLKVSRAGSLSEAGRWVPAGDPWTWLVRAIPVDGDRIAVLHEAERGARLTLLAAADLEQLGSARLG